MTIHGANLPDKSMPKRLAVLITGLGFLTISVGLLHFAMMPKLLRLLTARGGPEARSFIVPMFYINHIGSGVFLLVLGFVLTLAGRRGIARAEKWAAWCAVCFGIALLLMVAVFLSTLPPIFLRGRYFQMALAALATVGLLAAIPVLLNWRVFHD